MTQVISQLERVIGALGVDSADPKGDQHESNGVLETDPTPSLSQADAQLPGQSQSRDAPGRTSGPTDSQKKLADVNPSQSSRDTKIPISDNSDSAATVPFNSAANCQLLAPISCGGESTESDLVVIQQKRMQSTKESQGETPIPKQVRRTSAGERTAASRGEKTASSREPFVSDVALTSMAAHEFRSACVPSGGIHGRRPGRREKHAFTEPENVSGKNESKSHGHTARNSNLAQSRQLSKPLRVSLLSPSLNSYDQENDPHFPPQGQIDPTPLAYSHADVAQGRHSTSENSQSFVRVGLRRSMSEPSLEISEYRQDATIHENGIPIVAAGRTKARAAANLRPAQMQSSELQSYSSESLYPFPALNGNQLNPQVQIALSQHPVDDYRFVSLPLAGLDKIPEKLDVPDSCALPLSGAARRTRRARRSSEGGWA